MSPARIHILSTCAVVLMICATACVGGCRSPLKSGGSDQGLNKTIEQAIARELEGLGAPETAADATLLTTRNQSPVEEALAPRRDELDKLSPATQSAPPASELGTDLAGQPQQRLDITLQQAIESAVNRNLDVRSARLQPAISALDVIAAQAAFDAVLFSNVDATKLDQPQRVPVINGIPLGTPFSASETYRFETGVRQRFGFGTEASISTDLTRFRNNAPGISFSPNPAYTAALNLGLTQPLLRGFGTDYNRATIYLARNLEQRSRHQVRAELLRVVADAEQAYWNLVLAWRGLAIDEWLLEVGQGVREVLARRREFDLDITPAQYSDAVARVEQRSADVIRARRQVRAASDLLKALISDPRMTVASESVLYPLDDVVDAPLSYNLRESIMTALDNRPEVQQAALEIDDALIRLRVAGSDRLPLLNASAQVAFFGLDDSASGAYSELSDSRFIDYVAGLTFELPLGNRLAEARYRQARLQRTAAAIGYQRALQQVVLDVKSALRDVLMNYELIVATRSFRLAQAENLRTLLVAEQTLAGLTPEFLNLKFTRQETLATARRQEIQALVNFDQSVAALYRAMGIGLKVKSIGIEIAENDADDS